MMRQIQNQIKRVKICCLAVILMTAVILSGCGTSKSDNIKAKIKDVLADAYAADSMDSFDKAKVKWEKDFLSSDAADELFVKNNGQITAKDKDRKLHVSVAYSPASYNSQELDHYLVDMVVVNNKEEVLEEEIYFYMDESGKNVDSVEIAEVKK